jgi:CHAD domain-containing protein
MRLDDQLLSRPALEGTSLVALELLAEADTAAERLAEGADPEALHDFRVALRRLRSVLRAFRPWLRHTVRRRHEKRLAKIAASTNPARDAEVQLAWVVSQRQALAQPPDRAGCELLVERLEARARQGPRGGRVLRRYRRASRKLRRRLGDWCETPPGAEHTSHLGRSATDGWAPGLTRHALVGLLRAQLAAFRARLESVTGPGDQPGVHRARIEAKRLRYLLEPLRDHPRADASAPVERLKDAQDVLGALHDSHVLGEALTEVLTLVVSGRSRGRSRRATEEPPGGDPRPGILTLARRLEEHRAELYAAVEQRWGGDTLGALAAEVDAVASGLDALSAREVGPPSAPS